MTIRNKIPQRATTYTRQVDNKTDRQRRLRCFLRGCPAVLEAQIASGTVRISAGSGGYVRFLEGEAR